MESLAGPRVKFERAREHVAALSGEFDSWQGTLALDTVLDQERQQLVVRAAEVPELPLRWSAILGDAIHNYRCVLDHIVWQLALSNLPPGTQPPNTVQFPIVSQSANWPNQAFRVAALSQRHQQMVESTQPYHRGPWLGVGPPRNPLEDLRDLSNADKHRFVVVTAHGAGEMANVQLQGARGISLGQVYYLVGLPIVVGTELLTIDVKELPNPNDYEVDLLYQPSTYFGFANGAKIERVLKEIDETVDRVLEFFSAEPALLRRSPPELETPEEREEVALMSLNARLPVIRERLEIMGRGLGAEMPDPYRPLHAYFDDLKALWETEFTSSVQDDHITELVELVFEARSDLEERGLIEHEIQGLPALERVEPYPELVMRLELAVGLLELAVKGRLAHFARAREGH